MEFVKLIHVSAIYCVSHLHNLHYITRLQVTPLRIACFTRPEALHSVLLSKCAPQRTSQLRSPEFAPHSSVPEMWVLFQKKNTTEHNTSKQCWRQNVSSKKLQGGGKKSWLPKWLNASPPSSPSCVLIPFQSSGEFNPVGKGGVEYGTVAMMDGKRTFLLNLRHKKSSE